MSTTDPASVPNASPGGYAQHPGVRVGIGTRKAHIGIDMPCCQLRIGIANNLMIHILVIGNMYRYIGEWHLWLVIGHVCGRRACKFFRHVRILTTQMMAQQNRRLDHVFSRYHQMFHVKLTYVQVSRV